MHLRLSNNDLRIRLSREEALDLLNTGAVRGEFPFFFHGGLDVVLQLGESGIEESDGGVRCWIGKRQLAEALEGPPQRDPVERIRTRRGGTVSVDVDVFPREGGS